MMRRTWYTATAMFATRASALTMNSAFGSCEESTANFESETNAGTAIVNIIQNASVWARCCNQAPRLMKNAGMVQDTRSAAPA